VRETAPESRSSGTVYCTQCGHGNPAGSRFCSACGARLHGPIAPASKSPGKAEPAEKGDAVRPAPAAGGTSVGTRLGVVFGGALAIVVLIFLFNAVGNGDAPATAPSAALGTSAPAAASVTTDTPLPDGIADQVEAIQADAEGLQGDARATKLREGVELLLTVGRFDRAGALQEEVAGLTGTEDDWVKTGNHYYDWMDQQFGPERATFAQKAIAAYQRVIALNPMNLDARTDMAIAYMSDPDNPMQAIQENAAVLEIDSLHVQANFNRGIMLLQINRVDQALAQFHKVQRIVGDPSQPIYQLAEQAILSIEGGGMGMTPPN
jgi:tetratricopeptide (TPR) repeat protein